MPEDTNLPVDSAGDAPDPAPAGGTPAAAPAPFFHQLGRVLDHDIERELKDSYLTYAMSTIMDRALPDVRDGLKPSQRRILVAMNDLRLFPGRKQVKCAKICGDTSGNYHPHGESVIYPTLVNMGQHWRMRTTLIDPQGNFGSIDPDPAAAMRYTEARLTGAAADMLADIDLDTVDMQPNYDDTRQEPLVLPAKFPNLLVNGGVGIAVGMATSMAPNNPTEVLDSIIRTIDNPDISLPELMKDVVGIEDGKAVIKRHGIKGPDFPTRGLMLGRRGALEGYETGRGKVTVRGTVRFEPMPGGGAKDRQQIVIDAIPYNLGLRTLTERIVEAVKQELITDVSDVRNESGREEMVRVVVELKKGADPAVVEKQLYAQTPLQQTFSINTIALVNRQPRTLSLREMIRYYIEHRVVVIRRRTAFLLAEARRKAHVLEGMIFAVCDIDEVIRLIRSSRTRQEAIEKLMERRFRIPASHPFAAKIPARLLAVAARAEASGAGGVALSRLQAETIGNMRLIQLTGLEIDRLTSDYAQLVSQIEGFELILATPQLVLNMIKADCEAMRLRHGRPRLTVTVDAEGDDLNIESMIAVQDMAVTISHAGYAKRVSLETYKSQARGGKGIIAGKTRDDDFIEHMFVASTHDHLLVFTDTGRVFRMKVYELPEMDRTAKGRPLIQMVEFKPGEKAVGFLNVKNFEEGSHYLTFVSRRGLVKRTALKAYMNVNKSGLIAVDIREGDHLLDVALTSGTDDLLLATASGQAIRFGETDARDMGRGAGGVKGIELEDTDEVIGLVDIAMLPPTVPNGHGTTADQSLTLLTITENGYGKRTLVDEYRRAKEDGTLETQSRGGKGRTDIKTSARNGPSVSALGVTDAHDIVVVTRQGQLVRMSAGDISTIGRGTQGVRIVKLNEGDTVVAASRVPRDESQAAAGAAPINPDPA
ncbi:DNA gyrase subunit A [soil metagenome]